MDCNINFKGIYRIPYSESNFSIIKNTIDPLYKKRSGQNLFIFHGSNPGTKLICNNLKERLNRLNYSKNWLVENASRYNLNVEELFKGDIYVFSGNRDLKAFVDYYKKLQMKKPWNKIKKLFTLRDKTRKQLPEHLKPVYDLIKYNQKENNVYEQFLKDKLVCDIQRLSDLLTMLKVETTYLQ